MNEVDLFSNQSVELLKALHILTRDGKMNLDSKRKLKQVYHLFQLIKPSLISLSQKNNFYLVDHGSGKSYLGFILYDLFFKNYKKKFHIYSIDSRPDLIEKAKLLANNLNFSNMTFLCKSVEETIYSEDVPKKIDIVTALHACDTATDDALNFAIKKNAEFIILVPCCQAEVASVLKKNKENISNQDLLSELWRYPIHTREFGSHITNVLRCLKLQSNGYSVKVTELVGWEHSLKNEIIIAKSNSGISKQFARKKLNNLIKTIGLEDLSFRFC